MNADQRALYELTLSLQEKRTAGGLAALSAKERVILDIADLEAQVNNGGFDQFFYNSGSRRAVEMIAALRLVGAPKMAAIVERACRKFPSGMPSRVWRERQRQLLALNPNDDLFEKLDLSFCSYPEPLPSLSLSFWRQG
jgi:Domain of unknown function (DUF4375)